MKLTERSGVVRNSKVIRIELALVHGSFARKILELLVPELEKCPTESEEIAYEKKKLHFVAC